MLQTITAALYRIPGLAIVYFLALRGHMGYLTGGIVTLAVYALFKISFYVEHKHKL
jgi:hypothetical protein